jgi:caprin-1
LIMPSVSIKPQENGAPQAQETSIQAAIAIVEKKVRNLEKRKGKLDAYRDTLKKGKALNEDQQSAVDKYEEVIGTLEFTKELMGQFAKLSQDEVRDKKKQAKKDLLERSKEDISKVAYVLAVKEILTSLQEESVITDLKTGSDGAPKLTAQQVEQLTQLAALVTPDREIKEKGSFDKQVNISAEHLTSLADKKTRTVAGSTYQELHALINLIRESGYIESKWAKDSATNTEADNDLAAEEDYDTQDTQDTQDEDEDTMPATEPIIKPEMTNGNGSIHDTNDRLGHSNSEEPQEPLPVFPSPPQQQPQQQIVNSAPQQVQHQHPSPPQQIQKQQPAAPMPEPPSFNFLQESQIDLESPHMDPAVVMVHHGQRPPVPGTVSRSSAWNGWGHCGDL